MLEVKSIYLNRNKKQILSNFNLVLKKKKDDFNSWRKWCWKIKFIRYYCWIDKTSIRKNFDRWKIIYMIWKIKKKTILHIFLMKIV